MLISDEFRKSLYGDTKRHCIRGNTETIYFAFKMKLMDHLAFGPHLFIQTRQVYIYSYSLILLAGLFIALIKQKWPPSYLRLPQFNGRMHLCHRLHCLPEISDRVCVYLLPLVLCCLGFRLLVAKFSVRPQ